MTLKRLKENLMEQVRYYNSGENYRTRRGIVIEFGDNEITLKTINEVIDFIDNAVINLGNFCFHWLKIYSNNDWFMLQIK